MQDGIGLDGILLGISLERSFDQFAGTDITAILNQDTILLVLKSQSYLHSYVPQTSMLHVIDHIPTYMWDMQVSRTRKHFPPAQTQRRDNGIVDSSHTTATSCNIRTVEKTYWHQTPMMTVQNWSIEIFNQGTE